MDSYENKIQAAVKKVENNEQQVQFLTMSTGVVLKLKRFSFMRIQSIVSQFKDPEIPLLDDPDKGRKIRNPDDPNYKMNKAEIEQQRTLAVIDAIIVFGTEIETVPEDFPLPTEDSWIEELEFINVPVDKQSELARYLNWVKYVAIRDPEDLMKISEEFGVQMGTSERKVTDAIRDNFQG